MRLNILLKTIRIKNNMTQEQLSQLLHVSHQTISKWEQGINVPSIDNLLMLSDLYNISLDELIRGSIFFRKPFSVGQKMSISKFLIFIGIWVFISLLFTGFGYQPFWLFAMVLIIGFFFVLPVVVNDYWIIEKTGISVQIYPKNTLKKLTKIMQTTFSTKNGSIHIPYSEISQLKIIYQKKIRLSPFDFNPDQFFVRLITEQKIEYDLPIVASFLQYMPQAISYMQKKNIIINDEFNIIDAIVENKNIFEYMHSESKRL